MDIFTLVGKITIEIQDALNNINTVMTEVQELDALLNGTQTTTQTTGQAVETATKDATEKGTSTLTKWSVMMGNLATQAANKVYDAGKSFLQTGYEFNANMDLWRNQLQNMLSLDFAGADAFLNKLHQFAIDTPYSMDEVMSNAIMLIGNKKIRESTDIIDLLTIIGNVSNGENAAFGSIAKGIMQVMTKGKVQAEEANQQFAERGVDVWQILADYFSFIDRDGQDVWESDDVSSLGTINPTIMATSEEFMAAMKHAALQDGGFYYGRMDAMMNTATGQAQRMQDAYQKAAGAFTGGVFETFATQTIPAISEIMEKLDKWATENPEALKNLGEAFSNFATGGLDVFLGSLQGLLGWWNDNRAAFDSLLVLLGGIALYIGHPAAGTALIATGAFDAYTDAKKQIEEGSPVGQYVNKDPEIKEAVKNGTTDELTGTDWFTYHVGAPLVQFMHDLFPGLNVDPSVIEDPAEDETDNKYQTPLWQLNNLDTDGVGGNNGSMSLFGSLLQQLSTLKTDVTAAAKEGVSEGVGNITITGYVTTGDVKLQDGTLVGSLMPQINLQLGWQNELSSRG